MQVNTVNSNSKSTQNLQHSSGNLAASQNSFANDGNAEASCTKPGSYHSTQARPESGKKRTSYLVQGHTGSARDQYASTSKLPGSLKLNQQQYQQSESSGQKTGQNGAHESQNPSFMTSPPKMKGQTRKPSGKSTKSNRAAITKKQLITNSSQIFPQGGSNMTSNAQQQHIAASVASQSANASHIQNHQMNNQQVKSPVLSKINQQLNHANTFKDNTNNHHEASNSKIPTPTGNSSTKNVSYTQPRILSAKGNNSQNDQLAHNTQTTYIITKNQIDFRKNGNQNRNQSKDVFTPNQANHYLAGDSKPEKQSLRSSNSQQVLSQSMGNNAKMNTLVEHGAVAAVIPSQNSQNSHTGAKNSSQSNRSSQQQQQQVQQQQFLPTINSIASNSSNQSQSQAMYAATSISPYHSIEESQQNIPNQPMGSSMVNQHLSNQTPACDYFNLKQVQQKNGQGQISTVIRSTSQPHLQGVKQGQNLVNQPQALQTSQSFAQPNSVVPGSGTSAAAQQSFPQAKMQNLISKGMRSQSEPPQPQLKASDSTKSFIENLKQRATFSVVMKAAMLPKQPKRSGEKTGTEAQMASESVKATVTKLLQKNQPQSTLPFFQTSKISGKAFGSVKAFAANTNVGIVRKANEDRISIILNVIQPSQKQPRIPADQWPKLQIFGVYDGHGGSKCAEYLKDNLHNNIILQPEFPSNIHEAIRKGSFQTEEDFLKVAAPSPDQPHNKAGSCAIVILVVNDDIYIVNVGDSRAIASVSEHPSDSMIQTKTSQALNEAQNTPNVLMEAVSNVRQLSTDHKPSCPREFKRISDAGGYVYQTQTVMKNGMPTTMTQQVRQDVCPEPEDSDDDENPFVGPYRVFPGRLSVCRTFGDCEAKLIHLGGLKGVVSCDPEVTHEVDGVDYIDYVLIGSDGIFDKLKNDTINSIIWDVTTKQRQLAHSQNTVPSIHTISGLVADEILHASAKARSLDNISVVFVAFKRFKDYVESMQDQEYISTQHMAISQPIASSSENQQLEAIGYHSAGSSSNYQLERTSSQKQNILGHYTTTSNENNKTANLHMNKCASAGRFEQYTNALSHESSYSTAGPPGISNQDNTGDASKTSEQSRLSHISNSGKNSSSPNQIYLNKIRDQQQQQQQQQHHQHSTRHSGMLENINRPSSRQGTSRKGMRSRKANSGTSGVLVQNTNASHSQDIRSTLPEVHHLMKPSSQGKHNYNQLGDMKGTTNSASAATLPNSIAPGQIPNQGGQMHVQSQNYHQNNYASNGGQREQNQNGNQQTRRAALFKVNTQQQTHTLANNGKGGLSDFFGKTNANTKAMTHSLATSNANNNSSQQMMGKQMGAAGLEQQLPQKVSSSTGSRQGGGTTRQKMKPYKSSQIRRMPDNSASVPLRYMTETNMPTGGAGGGKQRDSSQGAFSERDQNANGHWF